MRCVRARLYKGRLPQTAPLPFHRNAHHLPSSILSMTAMRFPSSETAGDVGPSKNEHTGDDKDVTLGQEVAAPSSERPTIVHPTPRHPIFVSRFPVDSSSKAADPFPLDPTHRTPSPGLTFRPRVPSPPHFREQFKASMLQAEDVQKSAGHWVEEGVEEYGAVPIYEYPSPSANAPPPTILSSSESSSADPSASYFRSERIPLSGSKREELLRLKKAKKDREDGEMYKKRRRGDHDQ